MAESIDLQLLDIYEPITDEDIQSAQNYIGRRESAAHGLSALIDALLKDAAEKITRICYRYNIDPKTFSISQKYNEQMFGEIADVLNDLEDEILDLTLDYATRCTKSEKRKGALLPWILALGRGNNNLKQTLESRLRMFMRDIEAMVASLKLANVNIGQAITKVKSNLHAVYLMPEVRAAFRRSVMMQAKYLRDKGVKHGNVGSSNSEANNILRFAEITLQMAWMKNQLLNFKERGAAGFIVNRGSTYPCALCDSHVGWHTIDDVDSFPQFHGHCCCYAVPVFEKSSNS